MQRKLFGASLFLGILAATAGLVGVAEADHAWGSYHWARTANPFTLKLGDNVSSAWDERLRVASDDWSASPVLDTAVITGTKDPRKCSPTAGQVEVCNASYGNRGWLGIASIWASGNHITKGTVKLNDTYFNTAKYNTPEWRQFVMCQEIGHTFGLGHQDENFSNANLGTCMDYTSAPGDNQHPNDHDYAQLETIYAHLDNTTTVGAFDGGSKGKPALVGQDIDLDNPSAWGQAVKQDAQGDNSLFVRDLGNGEKVFTFVVWAE